MMKGYSPYYAYQLKIVLWPKKKFHIEVICAILVKMSPHFVFPALANAGSHRERASPGLGPEWLEQNGTRQPPSVTKVRGLGVASPAPEPCLLYAWAWCLIHRVLILILTSEVIHKLSLSHPKVLSRPPHASQSIWPAVSPAITRNLGISNVHALLTLF